MANNIIYKQVMEHIEVILNGVFLFSSDTMQEAQRELITSISSKNNNRGVFIC
ncbi:MAG TPA: hypothetical protein VIK86_07810 [Candidatus Paceibacterota bacterium]